MAIATQAHLYNNPQTLTGIVKIRKGQTAQMILSLDAAAAIGGGSGALATQAQLAAVKGWFLQFAREIQGKIDPTDPTADRCIAAVQAIEDATRA